MRKLHLSPIEILPAITPQDQEFAEKISGDFVLPLDEISWLVRDIRHDIQDNLSELRNDSDLKRDFKKYHDLIFAPDADLKEITITTNKGSIKVKIGDKWFGYFAFPLKRIKDRLKKDLQSEDKILNRFSKNWKFNKVFIYFYIDTNLNDNQRRIAEGRFLLYFRMTGYKTILSEEEFNLREEDLKSVKERKVGYIDWKHYISDLMRKREERLLKEFSH